MPRFYYQPPMLMSDAPLRHEARHAAPLAPLMRQLRLCFVNYCLSPSPRLIISHSAMPLKDAISSLRHCQ